MTAPKGWRPAPEALAQAIAEANRVLTREEFEAGLRQEILPAEYEETAELIRWFTRRYPTPAERLAYVRRAYQRWTAGGRRA